MDLDEVMLAIMEVVHVAAGAPHEDTLDQLASCDAIALPDLGRRAQQFERSGELIDEQLFGVAVRAPPFVLSSNRR